MKIIYIYIYIYTYTHTTESLCYIADIKHNIINQLYSIKFKKEVVDILNLTWLKWNHGFFSPPTPTYYVHPFLMSII